METRKCKICETEYTPVRHNHVYCSKTCKRIQARKAGGAESTERQYMLISGNWEKYFGRLCLKSFRRELLTKNDCMEILEKQNYRCALTGIELTCILEKGKVCKTNASIDRIDPKGGYTKNNIQLVCAAINKFRIDTPLDEFIDWCKKVANYAVR